MDIKTLILETDREMPVSVCQRLSEKGFKIERVPYTKYRDDKETYAANNLVIYIVGKREKSDEMPRFSRPALLVLDRSALPMVRNSFNMGMEDYIVEPINTNEIISRLHMLLKCFGVGAEQKIILGQLSLDASAREAAINGKRIVLTAREFDIIYGMLSNPDKVFSRNELMSEFWGDDCTSGRRTVDVYMTRLREKFSMCGEFEIVTMYGIGYKAVIKE